MLHSKTDRNVLGHVRAQDEASPSGGGGLRYFVQKLARRGKR
jgi:hypothetical protein